MAETFETIFIIGFKKFVFIKILFILSAEGCINEQWKGALTGSNIAFLPCMFFRSCAILLILSLLPLITIWPGQLSFEISAIPVF